MKNSLRFALPFAVVVFAVLLWRMTHPKLTDEQQIRGALDGIATQASHKSAGGITSFLSRDFQIDGLKPGAVKKQLTLGMLQIAAVNVSASDVHIETSGDTATSTGVYHIGIKREFSSPEEKFTDTFTFKWKREDGEWKVSNADGNKLPPALAGG